MPRTAAQIQIELNHLLFSIDQMLNSISNMRRTEERAKAEERSAESKYEEAERTFKRAETELRAAQEKAQIATNAVVMADRAREVNVSKSVVLRNELKVAQERERKPILASGPFVREVTSGAPAYKGDIVLLKSGYRAEVFAVDSIRKVLSVRFENKNLGTGVVSYDQVVRILH